MSNTKKHPIGIHIDPKVIEESKEIAGRTDIPIKVGISCLPNFIQYPYTNEDSERLKKAFVVKGKDGKALIRDKKNMLFIAGGGAILGSFDDIFANNPLETMVGIDLSAAQLYNFKYIAERAASEERRGKEFFLRRTPAFSNTSVNGIKVLCRRQEIDERIFGYPLIIELDTKVGRYFPIPAKGLYSEKKRIELVKGDIVDYLKSVEASKAPGLIYISNLSEWQDGLIFKAILGTVKSDNKFPIGTVLVGTHLSETLMIAKVDKEGEPVMVRYILP